MMALNTPTGRKAIQNLRIRTSAGLKKIVAARIRTEAGLKSFLVGLKATLSTGSVFGAISASASLPVQSGQVTVHASGGIAPYSYSWTQLSGDPVSVVPTGGADYRTVFFTQSLSPSEELYSTWSCAVEDATGASVVTPPLEVFLTNHGTGMNP